MADVLAIDANAVSVAVEDMLAEDWTQQVYVSGIDGAAHLLHKRPGYGPLAIAQESEH
uniref:hypothetical protein n=1 Tax=Burkholderia anthina TaxID=179879 RepID=UPI001ABBB349